MRSDKVDRQQIVICLLFLCGVLMLESWTDIDMAVQRLLYTENGWVVTETMHNAGLSLWFYSGPKMCLGALGAMSLLCAGLACTQTTFRHWLRPCLFLVFSLAVIPLLVSSGKQFTNIYCPKQLVAFGGSRAYQRVFAPVSQENENVPHGKGFPAGHASGGFALMGLFFLGKSAWQRRLGLAAGLFAGWYMGFYQMLRGEHFLSHTVFSMILAWIVLCLLDKLILRSTLTESHICWGLRFSQRALSR